MRAFAAVVAIGAAVALLPLMWIPIVYSDRPAANELASLGLFLVVVQLPPFVLLAWLARWMSDLAMVLGAAALIVFAVFTQAVSFDPSQESSTAALGILGVSIFGVPSVVLLFGADRLVADLRRR
jgi:hypothetical protein